MGLTRREFLKLTGEAAIAAGIAGSIEFAATDSFALGRKSLEETLKPENYAKMTKGWDPIYGPPLRTSSRYGGLSNFEGHKRGGAQGYGVDYDVPNGTPLVPAAASRLRYITRKGTSGLKLLMSCISESGYLLGYHHLDDVIVDERFKVDRGEMTSGKPFIVLTRNQPVALSGNSGEGPKEYGGVQQPHLHFAFTYSKSSEEAKELDAEKNGHDGGKPIFWDGETWLETPQSKRLGRLEDNLQSFEPTINKWKKDKALEELAGKLKDYYENFKDLRGTQILDSKHFQDLRALLKRVTLEGKDYIPGTKPYSLAQKILAYSMVQPYYNQPIIVSLPFISPQLISMYKIKKPVYEEGPFYQLIDGGMRQVK